MNTLRITKPTVAIRNPNGDIKIYAVDFNEAREAWGIIAMSNELGGFHGWESQVFKQRERAIVRLGVIRQEAASSSYWEIIEL